MATVRSHRDLIKRASAFEAAHVIKKDVVGRVVVSGIRQEIKRRHAWLIGINFKSECCRPGRL